MADVIRDVLIRAKMELVKTDLRAPDLGPMMKQTKELSQHQKALHEAKIRHAELERTHAINSVKQSQASAKAIRETNKAVDDAIERQRELNDLTIRGAEGFRTSTDGAFAFARGLALASSEGETLEQTVRHIAAIQARFDLLRGGIDVVRGGVETTRAFGAAWSKAGGSLATAGSRLGQVATFLGPGGTIAVAAGGTAVVLGLMWKHFADDADGAIAHAERRLKDLTETTKREADRQQIIRDAADRRRLIQTDEQKFQSLGKDIAKSKQPVPIADLFSQADALRQRDTLNEELAQARRQAATGPRFNPTEADTANRLEAIRRRDRLSQDLAGLGGAVPGAERDALGLQLDTAIKEEKDRFELIRDQKNVFDSLSTRQNTQRESEIRQAETTRNRGLAEAQRVRDQLEVARRERRERENARRRELDRLSDPERKFVRRTADGLGAAAADGLDQSERQQIKRLQQLAPSYRQQVEDAETIAAGGRPVSRQDRVTDLEGKLAQVLDQLAEATKNRDELVANDTREDARAAAAAEQIADAFLRASARITAIEQQQDTLGAQISEAIP